MLILSDRLHAFAAIVRTGTVHAAARELGLTQTAVTRRLQTLEAELKLALFLRSRRGMTLTAEGETLLRYCRRAAELEGEAWTQLGPRSAQEATLSLLGPTSFITARAAPAVIALHARFPKLAIHLEISDVEGRLDRLRRGEADFAVVPEAEVLRELASKRLRPERFVLVGPRRWKGRRLAELVREERVIDFHRGDRTTLRLLEQLGTEPPARPRLYVNQNETLIRLVAAGLGFGTLSEEVAAPHLAEGRLAPLGPRAALLDPIALTWYPRAEMGDAFRALIRALG